MQNEVDAAIDSVGERIELVGIALAVYREKLDELDRKLSDLEKIC
jgi:hypothetical protein